jgi:predicted peroxiredoxin
MPLSDILISIVERGCYECYADYGWDIDTSYNSWFGEETFSHTVNAFPILRDLIEKVKVLIHNEITDLSIRDKCNMELRNKLGALLLGKKANIFNVHQSADFMAIIEQKSFLSLSTIYSSTEREYYLALLMQKLYLTSKKLKERDEEFHFITAWNTLNELFPNQNIFSFKRMEFFEHYLEQASEVGLSFYLCDSSPSKLDKDILKQIPTIISGRLTKLEDINSIGNRIKLDNDQRKKLMDLDSTRLLFSFNDDSMVYECESLL